MNSVILSAASRVVHPVLLMFSIFLLLRGHNEPGGGFSGGLVAASAFILHAMAHGASTARRLLRADPQMLIGGGLLVSLASGLPSLLTGQPFLVGRWASIPVPGLGEWGFGTPLIFDVGVYLVVVGITLQIILSVAEGQAERPGEAPGTEGDR